MNGWFFFLAHGEWVGARNKQIAREPLRGSRDIFFPRSDSFPLKKKTLIPSMKESCHADLQYGDQAEISHW